MNSNHEKTFNSNSFDYEMKALYAYVFVVCRMKTCYNRTTGLRNSSLVSEHSVQSAFRSIFF